MNVDANAVIQKYKNLLSEQQYLVVLLELQVQQLQLDNDRLRDELTVAKATEEED